MKKILITGGTGMVGSYLTEKLLRANYRVAHLIRAPSATDKIKSFKWDLNEGYIDNKALEEADIIVHLAGASIAEEKWTSSQKDNIIRSRVGAANLIFDKLKLLEKPLEAFISASAVGYYGMVSREKIFSEEDRPAADFLGKTCESWEKAADRFMEIGARVVKIRTAMVLSKKGGALEKMSQPIKYFAGAPLGTGNQYMPWIHLEDLAEIYKMAIENNQMQGVYNAVAPEHVTNEQFTRILAGAMGKPLYLPHLPSFFLKGLFGEMAEMLLEGSRVSCAKIKATGFEFVYPDIKEAIEDCLKKG